jgi:hypothetical protein
VLQSRPSAHGEHGPPQSTSVSPESWTLLVQEASTQRSPTQRLVEQSEGCSHTWPAAQPGQAAPPQSTSVSPAFVTPSLQVGVWQVVAQTPLSQSLACRQAEPSGQAGQLPPQSASVSSPLATRSVQLGVAQV